MIAQRDVPELYRAAAVSGARKVVFWSLVVVTVGAMIVASGEPTTPWPWPNLLGIGIAAVAGVGAWLTR